MSHDVFVNSGPLLVADKIADIKSLPQWDCDEAATTARQLMRDALEKHAELLETDATEPQTKFFIVNPVLSALGYVFSIGESINVAGDARARIDYTLFSTPEEFEQALSFRGGQAFFRNAVALCQATVWKDSLELAEDANVAAQQPVVVIDLLLRSTGVVWGIVTNGLQWRLINRGSSDRFDTYVEFDLNDVLGNDQFDNFKLFYLLFGRNGLMRNDEGVTFVDRFIE